MYNALTLRFAAFAGENLKFREFKEKNCANYGFFEAEELSRKDFIRLSYERFLALGGQNLWYLNIDDKRLNSYPNFTQKHQICLSHAKFKDAVFQFRIACENSVHSLGYRLFINLDGSHLDFVASDITQTDEVVMKIKTQILSEFACVSRCGWWITDIWRDLHPLSDDSESENFVLNLTRHNFTHDMLAINETLLNAQISGKLDGFIAELKAQS